MVEEGRQSIPRGYRRAKPQQSRQNGPVKRNPEIELALSAAN